MMQDQKELLNSITKESTMDDIQNYIKKVITMRGFDDQIVQHQVLLLFEEAGELAKAIRKTAPTASVDYNKIENYTDIEEEVADVFIVLTAICNKLNINLYDAIINKEKKNVERKWHINDEK